MRSFVWILLLAISQISYAKSLSKTSDEMAVNIGIPGANPFIIFAGQVSGGMSVGPPNTFGRNSSSTQHSLEKDWGMFESLEVKSLVSQTGLTEIKNKYYHKWQINNSCYFYRVNKSAVQEPLRENNNWKLTHTECDARTSQNTLYFTNMNDLSDPKEKIELKCYYEKGQIKNPQDLMKVLGSDSKVAVVTTRYIDNFYREPISSNNSGVRAAP